MIVPASEIKRITGYSRFSAQMRWLEKNGWKFTVSRLGEPIVSQIEMNRHLVGGKAARNQEVNLEGING
jgi:hypothetical protein